MKYREVARKLRKLDCREIQKRGKGSHRIWYNEAEDLLASLPDWGGKDLKIGTIRSVVRQLGLDWETFRRI